MRSSGGNIRSTAFLHVATYILNELPAVLLISAVDDDGAVEGATAKVETEATTTTTTTRRALHRQPKAIADHSDRLHPAPVLRPVNVPGTGKERLLQGEYLTGTEQHHPLAVQLKVVLVLLALGGVLAVRKRAQVLVA